MIDFEGVFAGQSAWSELVGESAPGAIRTHTGRVLNPLPLPVGLRGLAPGNSTGSFMRASSGLPVWGVVPWWEGVGVVTCGDGEWSLLAWPGIPVGLPLEAGGAERVVCMGG
jgi:hypothetical protein